MSFPPQAFRRKNYAIVCVDLDAPPKRIFVTGDFLTATGFPLTTADVSKVYIGINSEPDLPLSEVLPVQTPFSYITLTWDPSETGKRLALVVGGEAAFLSRREAVVIASDQSGIKAKLDKILLDSEGRVVTSIGTSQVKVPTDVQDHLQESLTIFSGTVTSSGNSVDVDVARFTMTEVALDVTAVSGTSPTLNFYLEGKIGGIYKVIWSVEGIAGVGTYFLTVSALPFRFVRARWVVGGTSPSFTFTVLLEGKS